MKCALLMGLLVMSLSLRHTSVSFERIPRVLEGLRSMDCRRLGDSVG